VSAAIGCVETGVCVPGRTRVRWVVLTNTPPRGTRERHKAVADRETGVIKWYNSGKGYGFITRADGDDLFIHFTALTGSEGELKQGQQVEYDIDEAGAGPMARDVRLL